MAFEPLISVETVCELTDLPLEDVTEAKIMEAEQSVCAHLKVETLKLTTVTIGNTRYTEQKPTKFLEVNRGLITSLDFFTVEGANIEALFEYWYFKLGTELYYGSQYSIQYKTGWAEESLMPESLVQTIAKLVKYSFNSPIDGIAEEAVGKVRTRYSEQWSKGELPPPIKKALVRYRRAPGIA